jgi:hypothetical protein
VRGRGPAPRAGATRLTSAGSGEEHDRGPEHERGRQMPEQGEHCEAATSTSEAARILLNVFVRRPTAIAWTATGTDTLPAWARVATATAEACVSARLPVAAATIAPEAPYRWFIHVARSSTAEMTAARMSAGEDDPGGDLGEKCGHVAEQRDKGRRCVRRNCPSTAWSALVRHRPAARSPARPRRTARGQPTTSAATGVAPGSESGAIVGDLSVSTSAPPRTNQHRAHERLGQIGYTGTLDAIGNQGPCRESESSCQSTGASALKSAVIRRGSRAVVAVAAIGGIDLPL